MLGARALVMRSTVESQDFGGLYERDLQSQGDHQPAMPPPSGSWAPTSAVGVQPARSWKSRTRWLWSAYPHAAATSLTLAAPSAISSCTARLNRRTRPAGLGARPTWWRNRATKWRRLQPISSARTLTEMLPCAETS